MTTSPTPVRLTEFSRSGGCACKLSPADLAQVIAAVPGLGVTDDPNLLVGLGTSDDAAVYRLSDEQAIVVTTDFFTPVVDDPYDWGRVAAANALSDVYAMGGAPLLALNLVAWPREALSFDLLAQVLEGGAAVARAAGCLVVGGHSIDDPEPKYGMAVVGTVDPTRLLANVGARVGDVLVLTKPLGIGAATTAIKRGLASAAQIAAAVELMATLNNSALVAAQVVGVGVGGAVHTATDVTGFGLVGHLLELAAASGVGVELEPAKVPLLPGTEALLASGAVAGGTKRNHESFTGRVGWGRLTELDQIHVGRSADIRRAAALVRPTPRRPFGHRTEAARYAGPCRDRAGDSRQRRPGRDPLTTDRSVALWPGATTGAVFGACRR